MKKHEDCSAPSLIKALREHIDCSKKTSQRQKGEDNTRLELELPETEHESSKEEETFHYCYRQSLPSLHSDGIISTPQTPMSSQDRRVIPLNFRSSREQQRSIKLISKTIKKTLNKEDYLSRESGLIFN